MEEYILGLDVSTTTIGVALYLDEGKKGNLKFVEYCTPIIKPKPESKDEVLLKKCDIFITEFLYKYKNLNVTTIIIEEPLLRSNNVNTVGVLAKFNGMIFKSCYDTFGVVPNFISSDNARRFAFPELEAIRTHNKKGVRYSRNILEKKKRENDKVLFGGYPWEIDKKSVILEKVSEVEPKITWFYNKKMELKKENYDMSDAVCCVLGYMNKIDKWKPKDRGNKII
jgi:hypothetical protein